jgi:hypothetical protein
MVDMGTTVAATSRTQTRWSPLLRQCLMRHGVSFVLVGRFPWLVGTATTMRTPSLPPPGHPHLLGEPHLPWYLLRGSGGVGGMGRFSVVRRGSGRCNTRGRFRAQAIECSQPGAGGVPQELEREGRRRRHGHGSCWIDCL